MQAEIALEIGEVATAKQLLFDDCAGHFAALPRDGGGRQVRPSVHIYMRVCVCMYVLAGQNQNPQAHAVFVSILKVVTPQDAHWVCGM